jgi:hypothetical protein
MFIYTKKHLDNQGIGVWKTGYPRIGEWIILLMPVLSANGCRDRQ